MKVDARQLKPSTINTILTALLHCSKSSLSAQGLCNTLGALYTLGFSWSTSSSLIHPLNPTNHPISDTGTGNVTHASKNQHSLVLPGEVKSGLFTAIKRCINCNTMESISVSLCINRLAKLGCVYTDITPTLQQVLYIIILCILYLLYIIMYTLGIFSLFTTPS